MLNEKQYEDALRYNDEHDAYTYGGLPFPWDSATCGEFEGWTSLYQEENGLDVDGKMGPKTYGHIQDRYGCVPSVDEGVGDSGPSNNLMINGKLVRIPQSLIDAGCVATNFLEDGEPKFEVSDRGRALKYFVLHETCGNTAEGCKDRLSKRGYGVQLILGPDMKLSCHGDVCRDRMIHANQLNRYSVGIEVVNPYSPLYVSDSNVFNKVIKKQWWTWTPSDKMESVRRVLKRKGLESVPKGYVTPTDGQMRVLEILVPWICGQIGVPYNFPVGKSRKKVKWPKAGVVSHRSFSNHSDGQYILEHLMESGK